MRTLVIVIFLASVFGISCSSDAPLKCQDDYDCSGTLVCNPDTHKCEPLVCKTDTDCATGNLICRSNRCVSQDAPFNDAFSELTNGQ